jgi:hypothetical protein
MEKRAPRFSLGEGIEVRRTVVLGVALLDWGPPMHPKQYLFLSLACISFAILVIWLMERTLEKVVHALK